MSKEPGPDHGGIILFSLTRVLFIFNWTKAIRRAFVVTIGSGLRADSIFTMKAELTAENKPAYVYN